MTAPHDIQDLESEPHARIGLDGRTPPVETWDANPTNNERVSAAMLAGCYGEELMTDLDAIQEVHDSEVTDDDMANFELLRED